MVSLGEFEKHLEKQSLLAPVYLFIGEADLLIEDAWKRLLEKVVPPNARRFNGERLLSKECTASQIVTRATTIPMFGKKQLLMVEQIETWAKDQRSALLPYLLHPCPTTCLVLTAAHRKGLGEFESAVEKTGMVVAFSKLTDREGPRWLQERAMRHKKRLGTLAASYLIEQVGLDLFRLERELEKISLYVGDRDNIELEDVKHAVSSQRSFTVFELLQYVSRHQAVQAITSLKDLIRSGEPPLVILALLARQIRIIWQVKDASGRGVATSELAQRLKLPPTVLKNYAKQASSFSEDQLKLFHRALRETDLTMKSAGTSPETLLEALILGLCQNRRKGL